jgi:hypothetical protein
VYSNFVATLDPRTLFPPPDVVHRMPAFAAVLDLPPEHVVGADAFRAALAPAHMYFGAATWRAKCDRLLQELLPADLADHTDATLAPALGRATTWFRLGAHPIDYPAVLARHTVVRDPDPEHDVAPGAPALAARAAGDWLPLVHDARASRLAAQVVRVAGLDPTVATGADMDALDARFCFASQLVEVRTPGSGPYQYVVYSWRSMVSAQYRAALSVLIVASGG